MYNVVTTVGNFVLYNWNLQRQNLNVLTKITVTCKVIDVFIN